MRVDFIANFGKYFHFIILGISPSLFLSSASLSVKASVGKFFSHPLQLDEIIREPFIGKSDQLVLESIQSGKAMLPGWLQLHQSQQSNEAVLYGTPDNALDDKINIQIIGLNTESFKSMSQDVTIELYNNTADLLYFVELPLLNTSLDEVLIKDTLLKLHILMRRLWTRGEVMITKVISPASNSPESVSVKFGGTKHFSSQLRLIWAYPSSEDCLKEGQIKTKMDKTFLPRFQVDWCHVVLTDLSKNSKDQEMVDAAEVPYSWMIVDYEPPELIAERIHSLSLDFLVCVLIPSAILLLLVLILACVMCCGRTGWEKRVRMTPEPQLVRYNSIRRASISLRQLSENRELALSASSRNLTNESHLDGDHERGRRSASSTLTRKREASPNAPPPYRPPLTYPQDEQ